MAVKIRRTYKGAASEAVLDSAGVSSTVQTSIGLTTSPSNWPAGKFFVVVAPGTSQEEKMCVTVSGSILTVVDPSNNSLTESVEGRGVDDTAARSTISGGSSVYPVFTATDANEANELTSTYANQGGIVYQGASTFTQLAVGTAGQVLKVNGGATAPEWGQVAEAGIATNAVTGDKIAANAVDSAEINNDAVVTAKIADLNVTTGKLADTAVTTAKITDLNITTGKLADTAVTAGKLATDSVTTAKIANANVTNAKLNNGASGDIPLVTVSASTPTGGKNGDIWIVV